MKRGDTKKAKERDNARFRMKLRELVEESFWDLICAGHGDAESVAKHAEEVTGKIIMLGGQK
jgi:hypothetical protein